MISKKDESGNYNIGLVMAGAVTAGAFTGGVVDYLLSTLQLWTQKHKKSPQEFPKPNVKINTITGASAGSIAAAVTMMSLATRRFSVVEPGTDSFDQASLQYHTWVNYGLGENGSILDKLFDTQDLKEDGLKSLLNTSFIDDLIESFQEFLKTTTIQELPDFIDPNIEILMTLSNLRGIPLDLYFTEGNETDVAYSMTYHKAYAHFEYNKKDPTDKSKLPLSFDDEKQVFDFMTCARASGAFPVGLRSIPIRHIPKDYIETNLKKIFGEELSLKPRIDDNYEFLAVDGGMTNNEPIAEAMKILGEDKNEKSNVILIDPFPNYIRSEEIKNESYDVNKDTLEDLIPELLATLRNQTLFKEQDIKDLFKKDSSTKMIWPTRSNSAREALRNPIATGALGGFAGFFDRSFRVHDYMLGLKNCQNFIRYYFSQDVSEVRGSWSEDFINKFKFLDKHGNEKVPIIPDLRIDQDYSRSIGFIPKIEEDNGFPVFPQVSQKELVEGTLEPLIRKRLDVIGDIILERLENSEGENDEISEELTHPYKEVKPRLGIIARWLNNIKTNQVVKGVKKEIVKLTLDKITYFLYFHDLFNDNDSPPDTRIEKNESEEKLS
ncbi:MAG: patatin-like phospholipase family protein [Bacteroidia bacterium]|nr:patatin-like phospholipase family protein [Bacteroidia bacterium]